MHPDTLQALNLQMQEALTAAAVVADRIVQAVPSLSDCESLNASISRVWPVVVAKAALTAADAGLGGSSGGPSGDHAETRSRSVIHELLMCVCMAQ